MIIADEKKRRKGFSFILEAIMRGLLIGRSGKDMLAGFMFSMSKETWRQPVCQA